jgi:hypothetical protein
MPGSGSKYKVEGASSASFLSGLWHGLLMPLLFLISLFNPNVSIYETKNNKNWYHFGLLIGIWAFAGNTINISIGNTIM